MIEIKNVSKKYGRIHVLFDISFQVKEGSIYGLVGSNGVGKTTLLKIISGISRPDRGTITIDGEPVYENRNMKSQCFFMTEEAVCFDQSSLNQMRKFYKGYYPKWSDTTFQKLTQWFEIDPDRKILQFSKGIQRQASLILAFSAGAKYLFLDEAFDGLDMAMRKNVADMVRYYAKDRQAAIVVTSHNLGELEQLSDDLGVLSQGHLIYSDRKEKMKEEYGTLENFFQRERKEKQVDWKNIFG